MTDEVNNLFNEMMQNWGGEESSAIVDFQKQQKESDSQITMLINTANITQKEKEMALALKDLNDSIQMEGGRLFGYSDALKAVVDTIRKTKEGNLDPMVATQAIHMFFISMMEYHQKTLDVAEMNSERTMNILGHVLGFVD